MEKYHINPPLLFADTYSCGAYGAGNFDENSCTGVGTPDTGYAQNGLMGVSWDLVVIGGLAVIVLAASAFSLLRRKKKNA
ncbi:MAG TPA: hypothetical protein PLN95_03425 [Candidatus Saccharibacteria bacterium]|nr:hypothetical protein [Candidatus Saccharibacteria bacterium]